MRRVRLLMAVMAVILITPSVAGADTHRAPTLQSTEIGVTPTQIRIAVVADVDNPVYPGFFAGAVAGVQGAAKYLNAHGGLAGRKVVVDFIDSHLGRDGGTKRDHHGLLPRLRPGGDVSAVPQQCRRRGRVS